MLPLFVAFFSSFFFLTLISAQASAPLRFLYQNNGDWSDDSQIGYIISSTEAVDASKACASISEKAASVSEPIDSGLQKQLAYLVYDKTYETGQKFWVADGKALQVVADGHVQLSTAGNGEKLPVLCTQSAPRNVANNTDTASQYHITTNHWTGFRDGRSFRFQGVPYAAPVDRFAYSQPLDSTEPVMATTTGRGLQCPQTAGTDSPYKEACLFLNIYTPLVGEKQAGRPVMLWVHGGGFSSGSGLDFTFDGGNLASRGDVVVVTPNYRLGSLGFLSIDNEAKGNYGLGDVITALKWVKANIKYFGGDASKVTIFGQSAGAQIVEALLGSPEASNLFAHAIIQSGRPQDQDNALQTASTAQKDGSAKVIEDLGCAKSKNVLDCLRKLPVEDFLRKSAFSKLVVDGRLITHKLLDVNGKNGGHINAVPVMMGFMRDEMGSLGYVPPADSTLEEALRKAKISSSDISVIEKNPKIFQGDTINVTITAQTNVLSIKRCGQESTLLALAKSKVFPAVYGYTQDQRAMQILNYDPNGVCQDKDDGNPYYL